MATPDVTTATTDATMATTDALPPTPSGVEEVESHHEVIPTSAPGNVLDVNGTVITAEEMNIAELKVRIACQEKANQALRMELKCAELQVMQTTAFVLPSISGKYRKLIWKNQCNNAIFRIALQQQ